VPVDHYKTETFECDINMAQYDVLSPSDMIVMPQMLNMSRQRIGITGDLSLVSSFLAFANATYPGLDNVTSAKYDCIVPPRSLLPYFMKFDTPKAMDDYTTDKNYAKGDVLVRGFAANGRLVCSHWLVGLFVLWSQALWAGIVLQSGPPNWEYTIRMNFTAVPDPTQAVAGLQVRHVLFLFGPMSVGPFLGRPRHCMALSSTIFHSFECISCFYRLVHRYRTRNAAILCPRSH
jgi:hypothetical protein